MSEDGVRSEVVRGLATRFRARDLVGALAQLCARAGSPPRWAGPLRGDRCGHRALRAVASVGLRGGTPTEKRRPTVPGLTPNPRSRYYSIAREGGPAHVR